MDTSTKLFLVIIALVVVLGGVYMATGTTPMPSADTQQQVTDQPQNTSDGFGVEPAESVPTEASDSLDEFTASINADISNQAAAIKAVDASVDASATSNSNPTLYDPSNI